jgi:hypothetical protein
MDSTHIKLLLIAFGLFVSSLLSLRLIAAYIAAIYQEYQRRNSN